MEYTKSIHFPGCVAGQEYVNSKVWQKELHVCTFGWARWSIGMDSYNMQTLRPRTWPSFPVLVFLFLLLTTCICGEYRIRLLIFFFLIVSTRLSICTVVFVTAHLHTLRTTYVHLKTIYRGRYLLYIYVITNGQQVGLKNCDSWRQLVCPRVQYHYFSEVQFCF